MQSPSNTNTEAGTGNTTTKYKSVAVNANLDSNGYGNPMAGHAGANEIRPYTIYALPLISY